MIEKLSRVRDELDEMIREMEEGQAAALSVGSADTSPCAGEARAEGEAEGMTAQREARILEGAIGKWGPELQTDVAIEEMAELTKAVMKYRRALESTNWFHPDLEPFRQNIREEMADVSIMLRQLELIYGGYADEEIRKLERLERRVFGDD